jgi:hypothetical protein
LKETITIDSCGGTPAVANVLCAVAEELGRAFEKFPAFNSAHEGFAVLAEEVDELWDEVKKNSKTRSKDLMCAEAIQVAAMAMRFVLDVCDRET